MKYSNRKINFQRFCSDLLRVNDPTVTWGKDEHYLNLLTWGRALAAFTVVLLTAGSISWVYFQIKLSPSQRFLQNCQQQGQSPEQCSQRWTETR